MNSDLIRKDTAARESIVNDIQHNFFVEAGAGSGKTTVLVKRMVGMVEAGIDVSSICAITFTKAAANEFYERFQKALIERSQEKTAENFTPQLGELGNPSDITRERCFKALQNIDLCFMGTIDSFCNMILSEHPVEAGIPSEAAVTDEEEMEQYYLHEYNRIQNGEEGERLKDLSDQFRKYHRRSEQAFTAILKKLMATRSAEHRYQKREEMDADEQFAQQKQRYIKIYNAICQHPETLYTNNSESRDAWRTLSFKITRISESWNDILPEIASLIRSISKLRLNPIENLETVLPELNLCFVPHCRASGGKIQWYEMSEDMGKAIYEGIEEQIYYISMLFCTECMNLITARLRKEGRLSFFDYLLYLRDMLREDAAAEGKLIRHISERHRHFLIDEFQDTDPIQAEIFFYLAADKIGKKWYECQLRQGALFIVGDPKQSIYRFRNADVSSYLNIRSRFEDVKVGQVLYLSRNFRSTETMCQWFNEAFQHLLAEDTADQSRYELIPLSGSRKEEDTFKGVYYYDVIKSDAEEEKDAYKVADIIEKLVHNRKYKICGKEDTEPRELEYRDFMIITPSKTRLQDYTVQFTKRRIPYKVEGKIVFSESEALKDAVNIYQCIVNAEDNRYFFAVLKGSLFRLSDDDISCLQRQGMKFRIDADISNIQMDENVRAKIRSLQKIRADLNGMSPSVLLGRIIEEYKIFEKTGVKNLEYVFYVLELLKKAETTGEIASLKEGSSYMEHLFEDKNEIERCVSLTRETNTVHLANVHKVKGLERPVVILASPSRKKSEPELRMEVQKEGSNCYVINIRNKYGKYIQTEQFPSKKAAEEESLAAEQIRLLYVAATRARNALIISRAINKKGLSATNPYNPLLNYVSDNIEELLKDDRKTEVKERKKRSAEEIYRNNTTLNFAANKTESYALVAPSKIARITDRENAEKDEEVTVSYKYKKDPALVGTMVHQLMEYLVRSKDALNSKTAIDAILREYGVFEDPFYRNVLVTVLSTIRNGGYPQKNNAPQDILKELLSADEVFCELPFTWAEDNTVYNGIMDVVYRKGKQWFIVDYKTNSDPDDLDEIYAGQLEAYKKAFLAFSKETAMTMIYHIDI